MLKQGFLSRNTWIWSLAGSLLLWILMGTASGQFNLESLVANAYTASFLAIVALAQMLVVTTGRGAIDMSIPGVITLGAYLSMSIVGGSNALLLPGVLVVIAAGALVGFANSVLVIRLKIPSIIATMSMNYILITISLIINRGFSEFAICDILLGVTRMRVLGIPMIIWLVAVLAVGIHLLITKTGYGRSLVAMGQNLEAARLAGVRVVRVETLTYILSSILASVTGMLISARVGGAFLGMGDSYMMETVASIVVGGTLMSGGKASTSGTLAGSLFLGMIVTTMQIIGFAVGVQNIAKGALIIVVLLAGMGAGNPGERRGKLQPVNKAK